ncbi:ETEC_3214 domain-containing protein [Paraglaciecola hydrolytica]|uniref:Uncharacterized protein n=1 Tax=Paraglaciecola hydrolytica TaxID=1799789 RepID=A0A136A213_9ALTE|nr:ETEC_3214 domain-containing protein [Paraglaciecola hydrolytica]KXI29243.1 hypothetical protein AX660_13940 [Paraglaciecola hydrolytica]
MQHEPEDNGAIKLNGDDVIAIQEAQKNSFWRRVQTSIMMTAALMISAGQWNDTKEIAITIYESILANFTHNIEYDQIKQINVGNSLEYVKSMVGEPYVIKRSKLNPEIQFHYYSKEKYDLTLVSQDEQIVGYTVISKVDDFTPIIPFAENLGSSTIEQANQDPRIYALDNSNLLYFIDSKMLGKQQMFLTQIRGYVEYGANLAPASATTMAREKVSEVLTSLIEKETYSATEEETLEAVHLVRSSIYPNFYSMTNIEPAFIAEALLTRYEYQQFTQS